MPLQLIDTRGDVIAAVGTAEPAEKAAVYCELGVTIIYDPATHTAVAECSLANEPCGKRSCRRGYRVGGGIGDGHIVDTL